MFMPSDQLYSIILMLLTAGVAGVVGSFALMKRMSLAGDAMAHIALPGFAIAVLVQMNPILGGGLALILGAILIWQMEKNSSISAEAAIGVVFTAALALGVLLLETEEHLIEALFGDFNSISLPGFALGLVGVAVVGSAVYFLRHQLLLGLFSPELAEASGIKLSRINLVFLLIFSLTILLGLQFLGAVLAGALIIIPAAAGRQITHTLGRFMLASALISILSVALGFIISSAYNLELGPTVVVVASALFILSLLKKKD